MREEKTAAEEAEQTPLAAANDFSRQS